MAFSNLSTFSLGKKSRFGVDGRPKRTEKYGFLNEIVLMWTWSNLLVLVKLGQIPKILDFSRKLIIGPDPQTDN